MSNVRNFGATGDGKTDDTEAIQHALKDGTGVLEFPRGNFRITKPIVIDLSQTGRTSIVGRSGTAKVIMAGPGPAFVFLGSHGGTADPGGFKPEIWAHQRMPTILNLEIEGAHPQADGIVVIGTMQSTFEGVLLRELRDGIRIEKRARNVLISHCHIYNNSRTGVFFDNCNLHQAIITGSHISYNPTAGIKIEGGQVRNVQITGNDIEYNYDRKEKKLQGSADILFDCRPEGSSINEATIASNTIQAVPSPGGANVRLIGNEENSENSVGMLALSGNLIGSQETNIHLLRACSTVISGNMIYAAHHRNLLVEDSRNIVVGANSIDHNTDHSSNRQLATGVRIADCHDVSLTGFQIKDAPAGKHLHKAAKPIIRDGLVEIVRCQRVTGSGLQITDGVPYGLYVEDSSDVSLSGCSVLESREEKLTQSAVRWKGKGQGNLLTGSRIHSGTKSALSIDESAGVTEQNNLVG